MRWSLAELRQFLREDESLRILFVEGSTDVLLWKHIVPIPDRNNTVVYSIESVEVEVDAGGNRQRVVQLASLTEQWDEANRLNFFVDADYNRYKGTDTSSRVTLTDGRDVESYVLDEDAMTCLAQLGLGLNMSAVNVLKGSINALLRPVGLLRIASEQNDWKLPFQSCFKEGSLRRFFSERRGVHRVDFSRLVASIEGLLDVGTVSRTDLTLATTTLDEKLADEPSAYIIHGKDLVSFFSYFFKISLEAASGLIALSIATCSEMRRRNPNLRLIEAWVRA